jgi:hypothetical protein
LRGLREERGLSLRDIAFPGCSPSYLSRVESGRRVTSLPILGAHGTPPVSRRRAAETHAGQPRRLGPCCRCAISRYSPRCRSGRTEMWQPAPPNRGIGRCYDDRRDRGRNRAEDNQRSVRNPPAMRRRADLRRLHDAIRMHLRSLRGRWPCWLRCEPERHGADSAARPPSLKETHCSVLGAARTATAARLRIFAPCLMRFKPLATAAPLAAFSPLMTSFVPT